MKKFVFKPVVGTLFIFLLAFTIANASGKTAGRALDDKALPARIARVENGLLPGILIKGRPVTPAALSERMAALKVPGMSVAVINDGRIEWAKGYGVLEASGSSPVTDKTLFQAASLSKSIAALGAMRLVEQGKLALDEDVNIRLSSWNVPGNNFTKVENVTLRRLLSHTAGLTVSGFGGYPVGAPLPTVIQVLDGAKPANNVAVRVDVIPGSIWRYSGGGFTVVQQLMEDVAMRPFPDLLAELVLMPFGMADSTFKQPLPDALRGSAAAAHDASGKPLPGRWHIYPEMAAAGLWTTPSDLARFLIEIRKGLRGESAFVSIETARLMTTAGMSGYGLGLSVQGTGPTARFGHGGSNEGFNCQMVSFFTEGRGAVVMTNGDRGGWLMTEVLRAVSREYDWPIYKPAIRTIVAVPPDRLAGLTGRYEMGPGKIFTIALENGALYIKEGEWKTELFPESETRFFELDEEHSLVFEKDSDSKPVALVIDGQIRAPRLSDK